MKFKQIGLNFKSSLSVTKLLAVWVRYFSKSEFKNSTLINIHINIFRILLLLVISAALGACQLNDDKVIGYVGDQPSLGGGGGAPPDSSDLVVITITATEIQALEGGITQLVAAFSKPVPRDAQISWEIAQGTNDFVTASGTVIATEDSESIQIPIQAVNDDTYEGTETFTVTLTGEAAIFQSAVSSTIKVLDASTEPVVSFSTGSTFVAEGDAPIQVQVRLSVKSSETIKVRFTLAGTATKSIDYTVSPSNSVTFLPGEQTAMLDFTVIDDASAEGMEDAFVLLDSITFGGASIDLANNQHAVLISDNDTPGVFSIVGVRGGADVILDAFLTSGNEATVVWQPAPGATGYDVGIFESDGTTPKCPVVSLGAGVTNYTFAGCGLTEGSLYKISVNAVISGAQVPAGNEGLPFQVDATPPDAFTINGITGGIDVSPDRYLAGSDRPTAHWTDTQGENQYRVTIYEADGVTVKCPQVTLPANISAISFSDCALDPDTQYRVAVVARDAAGNQRTADNNLYLFSVTTVPTGYVILGATGGTADNTPDDSMTDGQDVTIHWQDAAGEINYDVTIYENDGVTVKCATVNVPADQPSHTFTGCRFNLNDPYKVEVIAYDANSNSFPAANSPFQFRFKNGLYISGTGGSYYRGIPITTCGGANGDVCNSANPYVVSDVLQEGQVRVGNLGVLSGAPWVANAPVVGNGILEIEADRVWVDAGGSISMTGRGYTSGQGPSPGPNVTGNGLGASGGAYGGFGGYTSGPAPASPYGSATNPSEIGSGGGRNTSHGSTIGGTGGGLIRLTVADSLYLNGSIISSGTSGTGVNTGCCTNYHVGGGAGGGIKISAKNLYGSSGSVVANGGDGTTGGNAIGAAGSGGRVALTYENDLFTGGIDGLTTEAFGGTTASQSRTGAAGTVFLKDIVNDTNGRLIVDNGPNPYKQGVDTPAPVGLNLDSWKTVNYGTIFIGPLETLALFSDTINYRVAVSGAFTLPGGSTDLIIANGGWVDWRKAAPMILNTLTIEAGGVLTHSQNQANPDYRLDIQVSDLVLRGVIDVSARGYQFNSGPGGASGQAGGSYGGTGALGQSGTFSSANGSVKNPQTLGSGGGSGSGGGAVTVTASQSAEISGIIQANGGDGSTSNTGGGSGGTINIVTNIVKGASGVLRADGGAGQTTSGGGGSGGRIALIYADDQYAAPDVISQLTMSAVGGNGYTDGAAGTIYYRNTSTDTHGHLLVANGANSYREYILTPIPDEPFDSIQTDITGTMHIPLGSNLTLPSATIDYRIVAEGNMILPGGGDDLTISSGGYLEWRKNLPLTMDSLVVAAGATITHTSNADQKSYFLHIDVNDLTLNGTLTGDSKGYSSDNGTGRGFVGITSCGHGASGAGHGGMGGKSIGSETGRIAYGDLKAPNDLGSGGGSTSNASGGSGGGYIFLDVANRLELNGTVSVRGANGSSYSSTCSQSGGGGAGGAVRILAGEIAGTGGSIIANGGTGQTYGGSGGGGRISLVYDLDSYLGGLTNLTIQAFSGSGRNGGAGTIYLRDTVLDTNGRLIVDNNSLAHNQGAETPAPVGIALDDIITRNNGVLFVPSGQNFQLLTTSLDDYLVVEGGFSLPGGSTDLTITSTGILEWRKATPLSLNSLAIDMGGVLTHSYNDTVNAYKLELLITTSLTVDGAINVDNRGYAAQQGPGGATSTYSGGAHGGNGGGGDTTSSPPTLAYDVYNDPSDHGSGGGGYRGGGLVRIQAQTLTLNGQISANGQSSTASSGAGAGGGIKVDITNLAGSGGVIRANGGNASISTILGGGGGGRIALIYTNDNYGITGISELDLQANGGPGGYNWGGAGTIFLFQNGISTNGILIVKNGASPYHEYVTTPLPAIQLDDLEIDSGASVEIPASQTITLPSSTVDYRLIVAGDMLLPGGGDDLTIATGGTIDIRKKLSITLDQLTIQAGGLLTHTSNATTELYAINLTVNDLQVDGSINISGKGFRAGAGPGAGPGSAGGAYGGYGGRSSSGTMAAGYGSIRSPNHLGSGGGVTSGSCNGSGGGKLVLNVTNALTLNGSILADGRSSCASTTNSGGSGGTIHITTDEMAGAGGTIRARGANGSGNGGSGSGGRIALKYTAESVPGRVDGIEFDARGGTTNNNYAGAAGTIYLYQDGVDTNGHLIVDNGANVYYRDVNTSILDPTESDFDSVTIGSTSTGIFVGPGVDLSLWTSDLNFPVKVGGTVQWHSPNLTIKGTGYLDWANNSQITLDNLIMESGAIITHAPNTTIKENFLNIAIAADLVMYPGSKINVDQMGYTAGGPGKGANAGTSAYGSGGGGHGGFGGTGNGGITGGSSYGTATNPVDLGSSGGDSAYGPLGGSGGGLIQIQVGQEFWFEGELTARGGSGGINAGGGAGGSINVITDTIAGSLGLFSVKGGNGYSSGDRGGGGAGGRIRLTYTDDQYNGSVNALTMEIVGGTGENVGQSGTLSINP